MGRAEEVRADHVLRPLRHGGDGVDVEARRVGGEDRARLRDRIELAEDALLERHVLEHRLDDEVGVLHVGDVDASRGSAPSRSSIAAWSSRPRETLPA